MTIPVTLHLGGKPGPFGGAYVYCPDTNIGYSYSPPTTEAYAAAIVLNKSAEMLGEDVGILELKRGEWTPPPIEMFSDDPRIEVYKPKRKTKKTQDRIDWRQ